MNIREFVLSARIPHRTLEVREVSAHPLVQRMVAMNRPPKVEVDGMVGLIARLLLVVEAQQRLLQEKGLCTETEFEALLNEIDRN
jgi:hypothetical protein